MTKPRSTVVQRARVVARLFGALGGFLAGLLYGSWVLRESPGILGKQVVLSEAVLILFGCAGAVAFALLAPLAGIDLFLWVEDFLDNAAAGELIGSVVGLLVALAIAALVSLVISGLPYGLGIGTSVALAIVLSFLGLRVGTRRHRVFADAVARPPAAAVGATEDIGNGLEVIVVDTSVLIDGRVVDVAATGFLAGRLVIPSFVLEELQHVADSADPARRARGRRGLDVVRRLLEVTVATCEVMDIDFPGNADVDIQLMKLARLRQGAIMTQDYNLNRLATVEGIRVLNLNELSNALKPIAASGDSLTVRVVKEGREPGQGVAYLDDGTMVVIEGGRNHLDKTLQVTVVSILQTNAGRMIFAAVGDDRPSGAAEVSPKVAGS